MKPTKATRKLAVPALPVERFELACGATLLVSPRAGAPVCAVHAHIRGGHSLDPKNKAGLAHLTGSLVDQGTTSRTEEELASALENAGGHLAGGGTGVAGTMPSARWKLLLELLTDCLIAPSYPKANFERHKKRLLDRLIVDRDEPRVRAALLLRSLVYGDHWMGTPDIGDIESIPRIQRRDVVSFHRKNWVGKRLLIAFCGDVDPQKVRSYLNRALRDLQPGKPLGPPNLEFPPRRPRAAAFPADRQQVHVFLGHIGIRRENPDYPALVVMDHVLGTGPGFTSRITRRLRDELGLAYTVYADIHGSAGVLPGMFISYIGTSPEQLGTAVEGLFHEIRAIQKELVKPTELELAKSYLTGSYALGFERASRRVQTLIIAERCGLPPTHLKDLLNAIVKVTREDVRRVAREHLDADRACLVAGGPVKKAQLKALLGLGK